ncbi:MAG: CpsD/CapB family tyrosine-protein kinase [Clostridia bacterium]|nr:CpsD/CapB family tyrosine-protein kinase [Clostridia bacterium]
MKKTIINREPKSPISEAYRTLRTNILFSGVDKKIQSIVITSSGAAEGKSTTVVNTASAFVQMEKKVILIDCDLRKPRLHKIFEVSNTSGLTNVLMDSTLLKSNIQKVDGLDLLTSGPVPPNPSEMLGSEKMKALIESLKSEYDYVIIDSPPVAYVTDGALLASYADGTILVVAAGQTDARAASNAKLQLDKVSANIIGVVLTKIPKKGNGYYKYHYANLYAYQEEH